MNIQRVHSFVGLGLAVPFVLWTTTGLLFLLKPGWQGAYEQLQAFQPVEIRVERLISPSTAVDAGRAAREREDAVHRVELGVTAVGPVYRLRFAPSAGPDTVLVDARTGKVRSPLAVEDALKIASDAARRATASSRYGSVLDTRVTGSRVEVRFEGGAVVAVDRASLTLTQQGSDTAWINALYRLHYLRWTGFTLLDRVLVVTAIGATWFLVVIGLLLLYRKRSEGGKPEARRRGRW